MQSEEMAQQDHQGETSAGKQGSTLETGTPDSTLAWAPASASSTAGRTNSPSSASDSLPRSLRCRPVCPPDRVAGLGYAAPPYKCTRAVDPSGWADVLADASLLALSSAGTGQDADERDNPANPPSAESVEGPRPKRSARKRGKDTATVHPAVPERDTQPDALDARTAHGDQQAPMHLDDCEILISILSGLPSDLSHRPRLVVSRSTCTFRL